MAKSQVMEWHAITPKKDYFSSKRVRAMVLNELKHHGRLVIDEFRLTTEYWEHKPDFEYTIRYRGGDPLLRIGLSGASKYNKIWQYVNDGTTRRRVRFHREYAPKTSYPGGLGNNTPGAYTKVVKEAGKFFSNKMYFSEDSKIQGYYKTYVKGIRPRLWISNDRNPGEEGLINIMYEELFGLAIQNAIARGMEPK